MSIRLNSSEWEQVRTAYASGIGLREIARNIGIPEGTVLARAKREGWTKRIEAMKSIARHSSPTTVAVVDAAATTMAQRGKRHVERVAGIVERTLPAVEAMQPDAILDRIEDLERLDKLARRTFGITEGESGSAVIVNVAVVGRASDFDFAV